MSLKAELQHKLKDIGYELGPFASKDTLSVVMCLHSVVMADKNINVAKLNDLDLRKNLIQAGLLVGPVTNHTRAIYQRKLLEVLTHQKIEEQEDEFETDEAIVQTEKNTLYPNLFSTKPLASTKTNSYSKNDESKVIRHDYKPSSVTRNTYGDSNEMRSRVLPKTNDVPSKNVNDKLQVATKSSGGTFLYASIAIVVAIIVFVGYLWFEK